MVVRAAVMCIRRVELNHWIGFNPPLVLTTNTVWGKAVWIGLATSLDPA